MILFGFFHQHKYTKYWWKNLKTQLPFVKFGCGIGVKVGHFPWFWLGTTKKALFWHISSILAMKGPQTWQKSLITWKYDGKTPLEKKLGQFRSPGAEIWLFKKKNMDRSIDLAVQRIQPIQVNLAHLRVDFRAFFFKFHFHPEILLKTHSNFCSSNDFIWIVSVVWFYATFTTGWLLGIWYLISLNPPLSKICLCLCICRHVHCSQMGPHLGTFFSLWVPIGSP